MAEATGLNRDDVVGARAVRGIHDGAAFDRGDAIGHGHHDGQVGEEDLRATLPMK